MLSDEPRDYLAETSAMQSLIEGGDYTESGVPTAMRPEQMVLLGDGRIGGPLTVLVPVGTLAAPGPIDQMEVPFIIFASDPSRDDSWLVDEWFMLCAGECDAFWGDQAPGATDTIQAATPIATVAPPEASPAADTDRDVDLLTSESCSVPARSAEEVAAFKLDPGPPVGADYDVVGPADPAAASEALVAANLSMQCDDRGLARDASVLESQRYIALPGEAVFGGKIDTGQRLLIDEAFVPCQDIACMTSGGTAPAPAGNVAAGIPPAAAPPQAARCIPRVVVGRRGGHPACAR